MDRDRFEAALGKYIDPATGKRRVTSLSKLPVPEEGLSGNMEDQRVAGVFKARLCGSEQLPRELSPSREACSCGAVAWDDCEPHECMVFGVTFAMDATWQKLRCRSVFVQKEALAQS